MARIVEIIPTKDTITCEEGNSCTFDFTVTNVFIRKLGVGAKVIPEGGTEERWLKVEGGPAWGLDKAATDKITVRAQIPQGVAAGKYKFHLCVFSLTNSDEDYTDSSSVTIDVKAKPVVEQKDTGGIPWWIPVSIVMVLLIGGGVAWWALSKPGEAPTPPQAEVLVPGEAPTPPQAEVLVPKVTGLPSAAKPFPDTKMVYTIIESTKGERLAAGSDDNVLRWGPTGGNEQRWQFVETTKYPNRYLIKSMKYDNVDKVLDVQWTTGNVSIYPANGKVEQTFTLVKLTDQQAARIVPDMYKSYKGLDVDFVFIHEWSRGGEERVAIGSNGNALRWGPLDDKSQVFILQKEIPGADAERTSYDSNP